MTKDGTKDVNDTKLHVATSPRAEEVVDFSETPISAEMSMTALDVARSVATAKKLNDKIDFSEK